MEHPAPIESEASHVFATRTDAEWLETLSLSLKEGVIEGVRFPGFPDDKIQASFVGSANTGALVEASRFYVELKKQSALAGTPIGTNANVLDLGCGWGRFLRFFWKDVRVSGLHGADVDPKVLGVCLETGVPGHFARIFPHAPLPYADGSFSHLTAYSVFTHLPEKVHLGLCTELARVMKPGGIIGLTLEPRRFLSFVESLKGQDAKSTWHRSLAAYAGQIGALTQQFDRGEFVYIPTGGGSYRDAEVYGEAVVPLKFIERHWTKHFRILDYIDDAARFWQAPLFLQRR